MKKLLVILALLCNTSFAYAGIANTKHNLGTTGTQTNKLTAGTDQICVFCHTPHGSDTSAPVPLWNRALPSSASYQTYASLNSSSIDGEILSVGSVSLACLSCHDGSQAMEVVINAPGSGGYNAGGAAMAGATWAGGRDKPQGVANLGTDLKNDHPIGIQYCGGGLTFSGGAVTGTCNDSDFVGPGASGVVGMTVNSQDVMYINRNGTAGRQKDDIVLFTRSFNGGTEATGSVECASCHDPHVESKASDNIMFMRVTTAGSAICLACHTK